MTSSIGWEKRRIVRMWYPTIIPHAELIVPEDSIIKKFRGKYPEKPFHGTEPGNPAFRKGGYCSQFYPHATFAAMVYRLDVYVGQIVQKLKEMGVYDNTIIIFASDNGPHMEGGADPDFFNSNGIWRGYKRDLYEWRNPCTDDYFMAGTCTAQYSNRLHVFVLGCNAYVP